VFVASTFLDHRRSWLASRAVPVRFETADTRRDRRSRRSRRTRVLVVVLLVVLVVGGGVAAYAALTDDPGNHSGGAAVRATPSTTATGRDTATTAPRPDATVPTPSATTPPAPDVTRRYAVGTYSARFVDSTRSTSANGDFEGAPNRTLDTTFWYPATSDGGPPDRDHGPYPLVLFVHGYAQTAQFYAPMLERWASAGYVVAGPTFPILSGIPGGASHVDFEKIFGDAAFVITQTLALGPDTPVGGLVDGTRIAAAGHSDGEMVSFTLGFAACCREWRLRSVVAMAGDLSNAGVDPLRDSGLPILHIMETNDEYDPYPHSIEWDRDNLTAPRWMLTLLGASHVPPYTRPGNAHFELATTATIDFFDGTLKDHPERLAQLDTDVGAHPDLASLER
jgi:dienelactone hydrolase